MPHGVPVQNSTRWQSVNCFPSDSSLRNTHNRFPITPRVGLWCGVPFVSLTFALYYIFIIAVAYSSSCYTRPCHGTWQCNWQRGCRYDNFTSWATRNKMSHSYIYLIFWCQWHQRYISLFVWRRFIHLQYYSYLLPCHVDRVNSRVGLLLHEFR